MEASLRQVVGTWIGVFAVAAYFTLMGFLIGRADGIHQQQHNANFWRHEADYWHCDVLGVTYIPPVPPVEVLNNCQRNAEKWMVWYRR